MPRILFDVGSCFGERFIADAHNPDTVVYAFEPDPYRFLPLVERTKGLPNFHACCLAVSDFDGTSTFNICPDVGCSSMLEFAPGVETTWSVNDPIWGYKRVDGDGRYRTLVHSAKITVGVTRLDTFLKQHGIPHIDHLHIDAQGSDLAVLRGLGTWHTAVAGGEIEVPASQEVALYDGQHTKEASVAFLNYLGFRIESVTSNDPFNLEENIVFARR
jgi:FkbM family methyltransferase